MSERPYLSHLKLKPRGETWVFCFSFTLLITLSALPISWAKAPSLGFITPPSSITPQDRSLKESGGLTIELFDMDSLIKAANIYSGQFHYLTMGTAHPIVYTVDDKTWPIIFQLIDEVMFERIRDSVLQPLRELLQSNPDVSDISRLIDEQKTEVPQDGIVGRIRERVLNNPAVLAKLAAIYEHAPVMLGAMKEVNGQKVHDQGRQREIVKKLIQQYVTDDELLRVVEQDTELQPRYSDLLNDPDQYAQAYLVYEYLKKKELDESILHNSLKGNLNELFQNGRLDDTLIQTMLATLRVNPPQANIQLGESTFFQKPLDPETLSPIPFLFQAFARGENNVEIPADLLPFKPTERLPHEISKSERARIKAIVKLLGLTVTVHSSIVGFQHPKTGFTAIFEDPADNVGLMKEIIDYAEDIGAKVVVVHISDREQEAALDRYAEIALHATGKRAVDGTPLQIGFENYMSKARLDKSRPFPTLDEHFEAFAKITQKVASRNPEALRHTALLLDSAHFNLTLSLMDPLEAAYRVRELAEDLAKDKTVHAALKEIQLDAESYIQGLIAEVHLNQNIGPIQFTVLGKDFNADLHEDVEGPGSIANDVFVAMLFHQGFRPIILAEQKNPLSKGGQEMLEKAATERPGGLTVAQVIRSGMKLIQGIQKEKPGVYPQIQGLLEDPQTRKLRPWYAYLAGRYGEERLMAHLESRAYHDVLNAYTMGADVPMEFYQLLEGVSLRSFAPHEEIIHQGNSLKIAQEQGTAFFYVLVSGNVRVTRLEYGQQTLDRTIGPGLPLGEGIFLSFPHVRSATVTAGSEGATVFAFTEGAFLRLYQQKPFRERIDAYHKMRQEEIDRVKNIWLKMSVEERIDWFFNKSRVPVPGDQIPILGKMIEELIKHYPRMDQAIQMIEVGNNGSFWPLLVATVFPNAKIQVVDIDDTSFKILQQLYSALKNLTPGGVLGEISFTQRDGAELVPANDYAPNKLHHAGATNIFVGEPYQELRGKRPEELLKNDPSSVAVRLTANLLLMVKEGGTVYLSQGTQQDKESLINHAELFEYLATQLGVDVTLLGSIQVDGNSSIAIYQISQKPATKQIIQQLMRHKIGTHALFRLPTAGPVGLKVLDLAL